MIASALTVLAIVLLPQGQAPKITVDLKDATPREAITQITKQAKLPCVFSGELPEQPRVTFSLQDLDAVSALEIVCEAVGLTTNEAKGKLRIMKLPSLPLDGGKVPVIGTVPARSWIEYTNKVDSTPASFSGDGKLVDLEVKDAPLRGAMEKISKAGGVAINVDETVSKEIKVTATIRKLPLREVLSLLVNQANLTYTVENNPDPEFAGVLMEKLKAGLLPRMEFEKELRDAPQVPTIHIVPKPELKVTGAPGKVSNWPGMPGFDPNMWAMPGGAPEALKEQLRVLKALPGGDALNLRVLGSIKPMACQKCHKSFVRGSDWTCCPYCGAKLPAQKPKADGE